MNKSGERPIWNVGSEALLLVVGCIVCESGVCEVGGVFLSLPPSLQQTGIRAEVLRYRGESGLKPSPHGPPSAPPGKEDIQRFTPCSLGILIMEALWRKSWKANWMWGLEIVREPGPGGGQSF